MSDADERKDAVAPEGEEGSPGQEGPEGEEGPAAEAAKTEAVGEERSAASRAGADAARPAPRQNRKGAAGKAPQKGPAKSTVQRTVAWAALALVLGAAGGWFAREARAHTLLSSAMGKGAPEAEGGSCRAWETQICESLGAEAFACQEAKSAAGLLPSAACDEALAAVPDTLAKVKEARQGCDSLVSKLCADLGAETQTCQMVKEKTPSFPPDRCDAMLGQYDQVIGQLRMMEQAQAGMRPGMGGPGMGGPGMAPPHGADPHVSSPHGAAPPGAAPAPVAPAPAAP
jgi:hypothetical protein